MGLMQSKKKEELKIRYSSKFRFKHSSNQMSIYKVMEMINVQNLLLFVISLPRRVVLSKQYSLEQPDKLQAVLNKNTELQ